MASGQNNLKEFPDLSNKLTAPTKKSVFERQKAEAEAKRAREEAETAAVYEDFVKSFENDARDSAVNPASNGIARPANVLGPSGPRAPSAPSKRHFAPGGRSSGPGSLGPPPNLSRKRAFDGSRPYDRDKERGLFAFDDAPSATSASVDAAAAFRTSDDEDDKSSEAKEAERAAPKPTLQLSSLPPGTSPAVIRSLIPSLLTVDGVRVVPPSAPGSSGSTERKAMSAIVTLAKETPASDIDTVVSTLQNRYLGWGFNLSISRHLSSAALGTLNTTVPAVNSGLSTLPFGAQPIATGHGSSLSRAPPPDTHRGGFAPPSSYGPMSGRGQAPLQVKVNPPSDITQLKLIHKTLESLLTHGPEFEALLMSRPEVQREEKWAWIWNPRSPGGVWYRWRLWEILTGSASHSRGRKRFAEPPHRVFDGAALWAEPEEPLPFEFSTQLDELVSDSDYNSSDEDESGDEGGARKHKRQYRGGDGPAREDALGAPGEEQTYLNPLQKAKLTHLLARLPTTTAKLRKGDVARVTAFAISHAGHGAEEVVEMLIENILRPFAWSRGANPSLNKNDLGPDTEAGDAEDDKPKDTVVDKKDNKDDVSGSTLIGLHLVSDILSASSTSGVRHAWRYRALFENVLTSRQVFPYLGRLEKSLGWGRLRAEKWRRSVSGVMQLWEGWCVFPAGTQERFVEEFAHPPLTKEEEEAEREKEKDKDRLKTSAKPRWKAVDPNETVEADADSSGTPAEDMDIDGAPLADSDIDGEAMEDVDGEPMDMEDLDGEPMDDIDGEPMEDEANEPVADERSSPKPNDASVAEPENAAAKAKRRRPKAEDMFADSDDE